MEQTYIMPKFQVLRSESQHQNVLINPCHAE